METNEIMNNEEVMETATEEIVKASSGKGFKVCLLYTSDTQRIAGLYFPL